MGGLALADAGVGAAHALAYPLGGFYRIPHGLANAMLIPHVMEFNVPSAESKFARWLALSVNPWRGFRPDWAGRGR